MTDWKDAKGPICISDVPLKERLEIIFALEEQLDTIGNEEQAIRDAMAKLKAKQRELEDKRDRYCDSFTDLIDAQSSPGNQVFMFEDEVYVAWVVLEGQDGRRVAHIRKPQRIKQLPERPVKRGGPYGPD